MDGNANSNFSSWTLLIAAATGALLTALTAYQLHLQALRTLNLPPRPRQKRNERRGYATEGSGDDPAAIVSRRKQQLPVVLEDDGRSLPSPYPVHLSTSNGGFVGPSPISSEFPLSILLEDTEPAQEDLDELDSILDEDEEDEDDDGNELLISSLQREPVDLSGQGMPSDKPSMPPNHFMVPDPIAANILRGLPEQESFVHLRFEPQALKKHSQEEIEICHQIQECLALRDKYVFRQSKPWENNVQVDSADCYGERKRERSENPFKFVPQGPSSHHFAMEDGVMKVYASKDSQEELFPVPDATTFFTDLHRILKIATGGAARTICHHRLLLLEKKFQLHLMLNADRESLAQKSAPHRDFYNVRKVDTHVHHSACMNQKHLLRFIKSKLRKEPDEVVIFRDGKYLTMQEVFDSLNLRGYDLNVDLLDVHADKNTFHRFDKFNLKYNPCGQSRLREIFIKQDNLIQGRYLAEVTKEVFSDLTATKYQMAEYRISVYGRKMSEWDQLASWIVNNELYCENVVWLIQLPRLYTVYKEMGIVDNFQRILDNVFQPLFEVTVDPSSHPHLHVVLDYIVGFDMVDDESKPERRPHKHMPTPSEWCIPFNPAYAYWTYYVYANLYTLNKLRESKGLSLIKFRPHAGEAGDIDHLAAAFLTVHNIAHGNNLRKSPVLQYLFYLSQIGLAMSPLSNNSLFLDYHRNPFPTFFHRGLNVSLSTDDPLMIHLTKEPLVEEYSVAAQVWKFNSCDLCEIARNSVYQSGFSHQDKSHWLGPLYYLKGPEGNDIHKSNVPHMRIKYRHEVWKQELEFVFLGDNPMPKDIHP